MFGGPGFDSRTVHYIDESRTSKNSVKKKKRRRKRARHFEFEFELGTSRVVRPTRTRPEPIGWKVVGPWERFGHVIAREIQYIYAATLVDQNDVA